MTYIINLIYFSIRISSTAAKSDIVEEKIILLCFGKFVESPVLYYRKTVKFLYY